MNQTLKRTITAVLLLAVAGICFYLGNQYFIYLTHIFTLLLQVEFGLLLYKNRARSLVIPFIVQCFAISILFCYFPASFVSLFLIFWTVSLAALLILYSDREIGDLLFLIASYVLGSIYVGVLPALTTKLLLIFHGSYWFLVCIVVVFSGDVTAYFVGRAFGKNKLIPSISPNKTWEGAAGGLLASVILGTLIGKFLFPFFNTTELIIACAISGFLAQSGDFFESLVKRTAGSKDSGFLLPGHGGFLDRFDGILFALPIFYYIAS